MIAAARKETPTMNAATNPADYWLQLRTTHHTASEVDQGTVMPADGPKAEPAPGGEPTGSIDCSAAEQKHEPASHTSE